MSLVLNFGNLKNCKYHKKLIHFNHQANLNSFQGTRKLYFMHYSCVVIILFNTGFKKSVFSGDSFGKLVFLSFWAFCVFCLFCVEFDLGFINFLTARNNYLQSSRCQVLCIFVLVYLNQFVKTDTHHINITNI